MMGYMTLVLAGFIWWKSRNNGVPNTKRAFNWLLVLVFGQVVLGIVTVLNAAPWTWAISHQILAVALWVAAIFARHNAMYPRSVYLR